MPEADKRVSAAEDVPEPRDLPAFWKSRLEDTEQEIRQVRLGEVKQVATSPGGLPVYAVFYGEKDDLRSQANYNSALGALNPAYYAQKTESTKPVVFFLGPVHGQEVELIVGVVNLIHILDTGQDHRGKQWPELKARAERCRVIAVPCANPDGRWRVPYDSFLGLPWAIVPKYGQGTHKDGTLWGWPGCKARHPMRGDVGILGGYYNDDGINPMHDDFFGRMAQETDAIVDIARTEAPDIAVSLHACDQLPFLIQTQSVPAHIKHRIADISRRVKERLESEGLPAERALPYPEPEAPTKLPMPGFNLNDAVHYVSGATAFTFETFHGTLTEKYPEAIVTHDDLLDILLCLFDELLLYALENPVRWEL